MPHLVIGIFPGIGHAALHSHDFRRTILYIIVFDLLNVLSEFIKAVILYQISVNKIIGVCRMNLKYPILHVRHDLASFESCSHMCLCIV